MARAVVDEAVAPLVVTVRAVELSRHQGLRCEACGQASVHGVVYALTVDGTEVAGPEYYRRCQVCHQASEEPFDVPELQ